MLKDFFQKIIETPNSILVDLYNPISIDKISEVEELQNLELFQDLLSLTELDSIIKANDDFHNVYYDILIEDNLSNNKIKEVIQHYKLPNYYQDSEDFVSSVKYANVMASIISLSDVFQNGKFISGGATKRLTNAQILEEYNKDPEKWNDLHTISSKWYQDFSRILNPSPIAAFYNVFSIINKDKAKDFFDQLCGFNTEFSSIKLLKKILTDDKLSTSKKLTASKRNALIIKAWNFFVNNTEIKMLKFDPKVEKFPTI